MEGAAGPTIDAVGVSKIYETSGNGVTDLHMSVPQGTVVGLIGPSGSGKTTTVRLLTGLLGVDAGEIRVLGEDPVRFQPRTRARIGYLPQTAALYPTLTVAENLDFAAALYGLVRKRRDAARDRVLEFVELTAARDNKVSDLSGGMRRRVGLAVALMHQPELIFLDEPTAGLDPILRKNVWDHLSELRAEGRTLIVTTQYVGEAVHCDYIAMLAEGRLIEWGAPEDLRRRAFGGELVDVVFTEAAPWGTVDKIANAIGATDVVTHGRRSARFTVADAGTAIPLVAPAAEDAGVEVSETERVTPSFDDVFVKLIDTDQRGE